MTDEIKPHVWMPGGLDAGECARCGRQPDDGRAHVYDGEPPLERHEAVRSWFRRPDEESGFVREDPISGEWHWNPDERWCTARRWFIEGEQPRTERCAFSRGHARGHSWDPLELRAGEFVSRDINVAREHEMRLQTQNAHYGSNALSHARTHVVPPAGQSTGAIVQERTPPPLSDTECDLCFHESQLHSECACVVPGCGCGIACA